LGIALISGIFFAPVAFALISFAWRYLNPETTPRYSDIVEHYKYGSIGSEVTGLPYWVWKALPGLFPEKFNGQDLSIFGLLYETNSDGTNYKNVVELAKGALASDFIAEA
jgi:hypothetical protein